MRYTFSRSTPLRPSPRATQVEGIFGMEPASSVEREWSIDLDLEEHPWTIGLVVGPSGSGKTTVLEELFGYGELSTIGEWPSFGAVIDGFADELDTDEIVRTLTGVGFSSPPAWLRPYGTLCADEATEILTQQGWRTFAQVEVGDLVFTLNHESGVSSWQPIEAMNVYDVADEPMLHIERKSHSSLTTAAHRWPVVLADTGERAWRSSAGRTWSRLNSNHHLVTAAPCADLPSEAKWSDALVELVAWYYTEGHIRPNATSGSARVVLTQSHRVNPGHVARIRETLTKLMGPASVKILRGRAEPHWRENRDSDARGTTRFVLSPGMFATLHGVAPDRVPTFDFIRSLTAGQLELFLTVSRLADGWINGEHSVYFAQNDARRVAPYELAVILSGRTPSRWSTIRKHEPKIGSWMHFCSMSDKTTVRPVASWRKGLMEWTLHTGVVWCPTTRNRTWLARRNGSVYFTGNSTGEQFRADLAQTLLHARLRGTVAVVDEFTSTVDRTVAATASAAVARLLRGPQGREGATADLMHALHQVPNVLRDRTPRLVAASCHYDIIEWLQPDWLLDMSTGTFTWRSLHPRPPIHLDIRRADHDEWAPFAPHHYLSAKLDRHAHCYLATVDGRPAVFVAVLPTPSPKGYMVARASRTVCVPDFQGVGMGHTVADTVAAAYRGAGWRYRSTTSHPAMIGRRARSPLWDMVRSPGFVDARPVRSRDSGASMGSSASRRTATFEYVGPPNPEAAELLEVPAFRPPTKENI